jgi:hypothetical protein
MQLPRVRATFFSASPRTPRTLAGILTCFVLVACGSTSASNGAGDGGAPLDGGGGDGGGSSRAGDPPACTGAAGDGSIPPLRADHAGALDPTGARFVIFGGDTATPGCPSATSHTFDAATWSLDVGCGAWTKVISPASPPARARHVMATDVAGKRALLFGGRTSATGVGPYSLFNDVWAFDFDANAWSQVTTSGAAPSARANAAAVVDAGKHQLIVFGGNTSTSGLTFTPESDTYAMDLASGAWRAIATSGTKPPAREFHAMAIDPDGRVAYLFSGGDANAFQGPFLADVWKLDLASETWSQVATSGDDPKGRIKHALAFDTISKRLVTFGGHDDGNAGDVGNQNALYALDVTVTPAKWSRVGHGDTLKNASAQQCSFPADFTTIDKASPERRSAFAWAPRADGRAFVIHGGDSDCGLLGDAWWWADGTEGWTTTKASAAGLSCLRVKTSCSGLCG